MITLKTGGKKAAGKIISFLNTCKRLFVNFTHWNSFSPGDSDISCHKKDTIKAQVFRKTCQSLPRDPNSRTQQPLSSQQLPSHEPCNLLLTLMVRLIPRCCQLSMASTVMAASLTSGQINTVLRKGREQRTTLAFTFEQETFLLEVDGCSLHYWKYLLSSFQHAWPDGNSESDFCSYTVVLYTFQVTQNVLPWQAEISLLLLDPVLLQLCRGMRHNLSPLCNG